MTIFYILLALAVVIFSADMMVKGAVITANKIGVPPIIIGLTIIAFGTSAPELMVTIEASLTNNGSIVIGNIVGSNIANIVLVLSVACIIMPLRFSKANISEALLLIFATLLLLLGLYYAHIPLWLGILMLVSQFGFIIYRYYT
jgi:cation:H+ antiporter